MVGVAVGKVEYSGFGEVWLVVAATYGLGDWVDMGEARKVLYWLLGDVIPLAPL